MKFCQLCWIFFGKDPKKVQLMPKIASFSIALKVFFSQFFFGHVQFSFENPVKKLMQKSRSLLLVSKNEVIFFHKGNSFHDKLSLARREQFWQPSWSFYIKYPDKLRPVSASWRKIMLFQNFFSWKVSLDKNNAVLTTVLQKVWRKPQKIPPKMRNTIRKVFFSKEDADKENNHVDR